MRALRAEKRRLASSQVLRVAVGVDDIRTVDPHFSIGVGEQPITRSVYEGLVLFPDGVITGEGLRPGLAERWDSSADRKTWTFHLRRGVQWHHDFGPFTSADVVFSLDRVRGREAGSPFRNTLADIESVRAPDEHTVQITLKNADAGLTGLLVDYAAGFIVCKRAVEQGGAGAERPGVIGVRWRARGQDGRAMIRSSGWQRGGRCGLPAASWSP